MSDLETEARRRRADRHGRGRRTRERRRRRRQWLGRIGLGVAVVVAVALAVVWVAMNLDLGDGEATPSPTPTATVEPGSDRQPAYVFATFDDTASTPRAELVFLLAHDREADEATLLMVPATLVADVPGHGLIQLREAFALGQGPLLELSIDNLLGVDLDGSVAVSEQGWSALFTRVGGLTIDVPEQLTEVDADGTRTVRFRPGQQYLDGPRLAEYLTFQEPRESEMQRFPRVQRVLEALLDALTEHPDLLGSVFEDGAPMLDTADTDAVRDLLGAAAQARAEGRYESRTLPVVPVGSGDEAAYRLDNDRAGTLVADRLAPSRPEGSAEAGRRLQILNGNGIPGIGQRVAERLQPAGFRVVLTRNANSFDHAATRIIVHDDTDEQIAAAQQIQELLGVGQVELSEVPLDVADITIIVGADFTG